MWQYISVYIILGIVAVILIYQIVKLFAPSKSGHQAVGACAHCPMGAECISKTKPIRTKPSIKNIKDRGL